MVRSVGVPAGEVPEVPVARRGGRDLALAVLCTILFLTFLDNTVVAVGLGSVQIDLKANVSDLQWVISAYALTFASLMLAFGQVSDEFGRKRVMLIGAGIFCAGSVMSALATNIALLIAGRAVMGIGAAASEPGTLSMLRHLYPEERTRNWALGVWAAVTGLGLALGPVIGGAIMGVWTSIGGAPPAAAKGIAPLPNPDAWRGIFWFNVIFGLAALIAAMIVLPENSDPYAHRVDIPGFIFGAAALSSLIYAVIDAESSGYASPHVVLLLCLAVVMGAGFFWWEKRAAHPLLDLKYLRVPRFLTANVVAFCAYFATFAVFFFTALYLEEVVGKSGYQIALVFLPMTVLMIASALLAGRWTSAAGPRWSISLGCLLFGAGLLLTTLVLSPNPSYAPLALALALTGVGIGATVVPVTSSALSAVPPERSGMAASAANTSREIGAVMGAAVLGALVNSQLRSSLVGSLKHLGIPDTFQSIVINAIETGGVPSSGNTKGAGGAEAAGQGSLVQEVIHAAYNAFYSGLHAALLLSAVLVLAAGVFAFFYLHGRRGEAEAS